MGDDSRFGFVPFWFSPAPVVGLLKVCVGGRPSSPCLSSGEGSRLLVRASWTFGRGIQPHARCTSATAALLPSWRVCLFGRPHIHARPSRLAHFVFAGRTPYPGTFRALGLQLATTNPRLSIVFYARPRPGHPECIPPFPDCPPLNLTALCTWTSHRFDL